MAEKTTIGKRLSSRFVAGLTVEDVLTATKAVNERGQSVSMDNLGENVTNADEAKESAQLYHQLLDQIAERKLNANVSMKLTHMGLDVDEKLAIGITRDLVAHAARINNFVRVDMEGSPYTQRTLDFVHELHSMNGNRGAVGAVIQAYMRRSEKDVQDLIAKGIRIRLCKGAYKEPASVAYQDDNDVDLSYVRCSNILLSGAGYPMFATHDPRLVSIVRERAKFHGRGQHQYELQMLYGVRPSEQRRLAREGETVRVYVPYGSDWYGYLMRRLAERPSNLSFFLRSLVTKR